jgi:hypothetical protein
MDLFTRLSNSTLVGLLWLKRQFRSSLKVELPDPVNPPGRMSIGNAITPTWSVKIRFSNREDVPTEIVELWLSEQDAGNWRIDEIFLEGGRQISLPLTVDRIVECWLRATSPRKFSSLPLTIGPLTLNLRDHSQREGKCWTFQVRSRPTRID